METNDVRRTPRYSLAVDIEMTNVISGIRIEARTKMLSVAGCGVDALKLFPQGTSVRVRLSYQGKEATALARVVYARPDLGMGLAFTTLERKDERILETWIAEYLAILVQ